jgi:non-heme chloroperoxidase
MHKLLLCLLSLLVVVAIIPIAVIVFNAPTSPPAMAFMAAPSRQIAPGLPAPRQFRARDGASLQYYAYPAEPDKIAVLIHGSAFPGTTMHPLAEALRAAGITGYMLDIRGHGGSGRRGDIDYVGQIDDDLADFVAQLGPAGSGETRTLVSFSAGAGFTIRFAGGPYGPLFDRPPAPGDDRLARSPGHSLVRGITRHQLRGIPRDVAIGDIKLFLSADDEFRCREPV